jgi:HSP20 family molecular chaperone IbpA
MLTTTWETVSSMDRFIDDVMGSALGAATNPRTFSPNVDVRASDTEVRVICDVPGVKREDLDISLENRVLTIRGSRSFESSENEQVMLGRSYGEFQRQFALPDSLDDAPRRSSRDQQIVSGARTCRSAQRRLVSPRRLCRLGGDGTDRGLREAATAWCGA